MAVDRGRGGGGSGGVRNDRQERSAVVEARRSGNERGVLPNWPKTSDDEDVAFNQSNSCHVTEPWSRDYTSSKVTHATSISVVQSVVSVGDQSETDEQCSTSSMLINLAPQMHAPSRPVCHALFTLAFVAKFNFTAPWFRSVIPRKLNKKYIHRSHSRRVAIWVGNLLPAYNHESTGDFAALPLFTKLHLSYWFRHIFQTTKVVS